MKRKTTSGSLPPGSLSTTYRDSGKLLHAGTGGEKSVDFFSELDNWWIRDEFFVNSCGVEKQKLFQQPTVSILEVYQSRLPQCLVIGLKSPRKNFIEMAKNHKKITYP